MELTTTDANIASQAGVSVETVRATFADLYKKAFDASLPIIAKEGAAAKIKIVKFTPDFRTVESVKDAF